MREGGSLGLPPALCGSIGPEKGDGPGSVWEMRLAVRSSGLRWARVGGQRLDSRQCKHFPLEGVGGPASGGGRQVHGSRWDGGTSARLPNEQASKGMYDRLPCTVCSMPVVFVGLGWLGAAVWILEGL